MNIAEKLLQIAENQLKVYEAGKQSAEHGGEQPSYETIVFAQDCTNAKQAYDILSATMSPEDKLVMFVNKTWAGWPNTDNTVNNQGLWMLCLCKEWSPQNSNHSMLLRFRAGTYNLTYGITSGLDYTVSAGEEWLKVVLA